MKEEANGQHKCDLNNATYEHDNEHSGDLEKNESYMYRGAEVNIKPVTKYNLFYRPFRPIFFVGIVFEQNLRIARQSRAFKTVNHDRSASL